MGSHKVMDRISNHDMMRLELVKARPRLRHGGFDGRSTLKALNCIDIVSFLFRGERSPNICAKKRSHECYKLCNS